MNNLMRKEEDVVFPAKYEEAQLKEKPAATSEKKGFFQKLFGK